MLRRPILIEVWYEANSEKHTAPLFGTIYCCQEIIEKIEHILCAAYGTYVVFGTELHCRISKTVVLSPKKEIMILVILTWCFQVLTV